MVVISGELISRRHRPERGAVPDDIVRVVEEQRPDGPAAKAIVLVDRRASRAARARYLSWIGYADLDQACSFEFGLWELVEPATAYTTEAEWLPFGWGASAPVWGYAGCGAAAASSIMSRERATPRN